MGVTPQRGAGIYPSLPNLLPFDANNIYSAAGYNTAVTELLLGSGETFVVPAGNWIVNPGPYTFIQYRDPVTRLWRNTSQTPNASRTLISDGVNVRLANLTGCALGAIITNVGSGYTSAPSVSPSAGSSAWTAIVGGAISTTVTITTAGAGYSHKPQLIVEPPPAGGLPATAYVTVSAGAIATVVVLDQGAGYVTAPRITVVPDPRDTITTQAVLTATLTGSGTITGIVCTDHGNPLTSVPTLTISGGGGASGAATVVMCFTATGLTVAGGGAVYGNAQPFAVITADGRCAATPGAVTNPTFGANLLQPRQAVMAGVSEAGGAITATGIRVTDGGLFSAVPIGLVLPGGAAVPTTTATVTIPVGGVPDVSLLQAL